MKVTITTMSCAICLGPVLIDTFGLRFCGCSKCDTLVPAPPWWVGEDAFREAEAHRRASEARGNATDFEPDV